MSKLRKATLGICIVFAGWALAEESAIRNGLQTGFQINQYQDDFGLGLTLTSPFVGEFFALRIRANLMFNENTRNEKAEWDAYYNITAGLVGVGGHVTDRIRLYGEGGFIGLFPASEFSDKDFKAGGYGAFGFEFFMDPRRNYFIEIGGVGTDARKDKVTGQPLYSNGLTISTGFRVTW